MRSIPAALLGNCSNAGNGPFPRAFLRETPWRCYFWRHCGATGRYPEDRSMIPIHATMMFVNATISAPPCSPPWGILRGCAHIPAPTSVVVAWQLLPAMAATALECLLSTAVINALFKVNWPLWGPALFMSVALAAFAAIFG